MLDPTELLSMIAQGLETDSEGLILPHVSVHALNGIHDFRTIRVTTSIRRKAIQVLIDTGSTHNFLDMKTAKRLGCSLNAIAPFTVSVADGNKYTTTICVRGYPGKCKVWCFESDSLVLPIGGCNMVLSIQWLIIFRDIIWNFKKLKMEFNVIDQKVSLRGIQTHVIKMVIKMIQQGQMEKLLAKLVECV